MIRGLAVLGLLALTACAPQSDGVTLVRSIGPGATTPNSATTVALFKAVCIESRGQHSAMLKILAGMPVARDPESDIYYHDVYDTSYKAVFEDGGEACSFVSGVANNATAIALQLEGAGKAADLSVGARGDRSESGARYVVARAYAR